MKKKLKPIAEMTEEEKRRFVRSRPVPCGGYADTTLNQYITDKQWDAYWKDK